MVSVIGILLSGLIGGHLINMLIYRLPRRHHWIPERFKSPQCQYGCHCVARISWHYVAVECAAPLLLWVAYMQSPYFGWLFFKLAIFYWVCLTIFFTDFETTIIPDELSLGLVAFGLISRMIAGGFWDGIFGAAIGFGVYFSIGFFSKLIYKKDTLGGGDMKLGAGFGAVWGVYLALYMIYLSFVIGAVVGLLLIALSIKKRCDYIPFGPIMIMAAMVVLFIFY